ncbi:MAG TPA: STAS/SEC14 domain-containing protein [Bacteroidia bacterium]|nr:STAS/SEC14 domain-containing protein [Bacteroidia bacterium]
MTLPIVKNNLRLYEVKAEIYSDELGFARLDFFPGTEIDEKDAREILRISLQTRTGDERFYVLIDLENLERVNDKARDFLAGDEMLDFLAAIALVAKTPAMKLVGNFFIRYHKPRLPVRLFSEIEPARKWLSGVRGSS